MISSITSALSWLSTGKARKYDTVMVCLVTSCLYVTTSINVDHYMIFYVYIIIKVNSSISYNAIIVTELWMLALFASLRPCKLCSSYISVSHRHWENLNVWYHLWSLCKIRCLTSKPPVYCSFFFYILVSHKTLMLLPVTICFLVTTLPNLAFTGVEVSDTVNP